MTQRVEALLASKQREATQSSQHFCASSEPNSLMHIFSKKSGARSTVMSLSYQYSLHCTEFQVSFVKNKI